MTSLDELLAQLQAEHQQKQQSLSPLSSCQSGDIKEDVGNIDCFLTELNAQYGDKQEKQRRESIMNEDKSKTDIEQSLAELSGKFISKSASSPESQRIDEITQQLSHIAPKQSVKVEELLEDVTKGFRQQSPQKVSSTPKSGAVDEAMANFTISKPVPSAKVEDLLEDVTKGFVQQRQQQIASGVPISGAKLDESELTRLQQEYQQKKQQTVYKNSEQQLQDIREKELQEQRKRKNLERKAEQWLKNLDPHSDEGLWFEQFAYSYESKLAAAIDYVQALQ